MWRVMKERHTHDCTKCVYLATTTVNEKWGTFITDWYHCRGALSEDFGGEIVGRFGEDVGDYWSTIVSTILAADQDPNNKTNNFTEHTKMMVKFAKELAKK